MEWNVCVQMSHTHPAGREPAAARPRAANKQYGESGWFVCRRALSVVQSNLRPAAVSCTDVPCQQPRALDKLATEHAPPHLTEAPAFLRLVRFWGRVKPGLKHVRSFSQLRPRGRCKLHSVASLRETTRLMTEAILGQSMVHTLGLSHLRVWTHDHDPARIPFRNTLWSC